MDRVEINHESLIKSFTNGDQPILTIIINVRIPKPTLSHVSIRVTDLINCKSEKSTLN